MMFGKVNVPLLGLAENMSYLENPDGTKNFVFGQGGGAIAARDLETELLGQVPLDPAIGQGSDRGIPAVIGHPDSAAGQAFQTMAKNLLQKLGL